MNVKEKSYLRLLYFVLILIFDILFRRRRRKSKGLDLLQGLLKLGENQEMGCVYSSGKVDRSDFLSNSDDYFNGIDKGGYLNSFDSGELRLTSVRSGNRKVPEISSLIGRASFTGVEKALEVLDTLGSSVSNLNSSSGFVSRTSNRGSKVSILAFEVANTIAKGSNLLRSLSKENIHILREEVLKSDGVRKLVSMDDRELMIIAAADKRYELDVFSAEVVRFGNLCKDPTWHNLDRYFQTLKLEWPQEPIDGEIEATMQQLISLAQNTSELYHELHALDKFDQDYQRKLQVKEEVHASNHENLLILQSELKRQRRLVKRLKKRSLWFRNLEEVVEKLVEVAVYLHKQITESFGITDNDLDEQGLVHHKRLGLSGLALHYANIVNKIDNIYFRPLSVPANTRDTLYQGLPVSIKSALRSRIHLSDSDEEYTVAQIKAEMQKTLKWIVPLAENTIKAHQGFGWVGEWANISSDTNKNPTSQQTIARIQTLYHADTEKTEEHILELVVWLHRLVLQVRDKGFGYSPSNITDNKTSKEKKKRASSKSNDEALIIHNFTEEEKEMLDGVGSKKLPLQRSKSQETGCSKQNRCRRTTQCNLSKSFGSSPSREFYVSLDYLLEKTRLLDILDGLSS